ncbi:SDR family NAD(P)-dependent oxidoreductase [Methylosinus sp. LW3]|uniref:SDR family NAD(P)-dependent oxidoreductase n=1 Tax=Methylosinus sp. LW3 TaxID=107635 RepID=UPI000463BF38|nr:SDR family NAD(P)-dependent oxidoreductase [Methylosinus sp. LW3]
MSIVESADSTGDTARVALITGATAGMGLEIARQLAAKGLKVVIGARDVERGDSVVTELREGGDVVALALDVTDSAGVSQAAIRLAGEIGRLDVLINNAGIARDQHKRPTETTLQDFRETYETNVFGVAMVTNAFLPLLMKSEDGRVINQSALLGSHSMTARMEPPLVKLNWLAYNSSKAALNSLTLEYAKHLRETSVKVYATSPGQVATALNGYRAGGVTPAEGAEVAVRLATLDPAPTSGGFWGPAGRLDW